MRRLIHRPPHRGRPTPAVRRAALLALLALAVGSAGAAPALARSPSSSGTVAVAKLLHARIAAVKRADGGIPVLVPTTMPLGGPGILASSASAGRYNLELDTTPHCDMANVCLLADFYAVRVSDAGGQGLYPMPVTLHGGIHGGFGNIQCGAVCTPAGVDWIEFGTLYTIHANPTVNDHPNAPPGALKAVLVAAADQAIAAGPR